MGARATRRKIYSFAGSLGSYVLRKQRTLHRHICHRQVSVCVINFMECLQHVGLLMSYKPFVNRYFCNLSYFNLKTFLFFFFQKRTKIAQRLGSRPQTPSVTRLSTLAYSTRLLS